MGSWGKMADKQYVAGPEERSDEDQEIADLNRQGLGDTEQIQPTGGQDSADPCSRICKSPSCLLW